MVDLVKFLLVVIASRGRVSKFHYRSGIVPNFECDTCFLSLSSSQFKLIIPLCLLFALRVASFLPSNFVTKI